MKKAKIRKWALIVFIAALAGFIAWNMVYANAVYERSQEIAARADATIARSEESLRRHYAGK